MEEGRDRPSEVLAVERLQPAALAPQWRRAEIGPRRGGEPEPGEPLGRAAMEEGRDRPSEGRQ